MTEDGDYQWKRRHEVLYRAELSTLYHRKRERFFVLADRWSKALAVIFGSAAWAKIGGVDGPMISAAIVTISGSIALVFGFADRARAHSDKAVEFKRLESDVVRAGESSFTTEQIDGWHARLREIEAGEPLALSALVVMCQNEMAVAQEQSDKVISMSRVEKFAAHFFDFMPENPSANK